MKSYSKIAKQKVMLVLGTVALFAMSGYASAVEISLEGTSVASPKVRAFETLHDDETSGGPLLVQATAYFDNSIVNMNASTFNSNPIPLPGLDNVGFFFVGTLTQEGGAVDQYFFNRFVFCERVNRQGTFVIDFNNTAAGNLGSANETRIINCALVIYND